MQTDSKFGEFFCICNRLIAEWRRYSNDFQGANTWNGVSAFTNCCRLSVRKAKAGANTWQYVSLGTCTRNPYKSNKQDWLDSSRMSCCNSAILNTFRTELCLERHKITLSSRRVRVVYMWERELFNRVKRFIPVVFGLNRNKKRLPKKRPKTLLDTSK